MCIGHGLCVSELSFLPSCTYIHCMWGLLGVFACVLFVSFLVMYLHFSISFSIFCSALCYAGDCSCTFMQASMTCIFIYMYITVYSFLKAVSSFTISLSFPNASVLYTYFSCIQ